MPCSYSSPVSGHLVLSTDFLNSLFPDTLPFLNGEDLLSIKYSGISPEEQVKDVPKKHLYQQL